MAITPVMSLVTLGVRDIAAMTRFYVALGFELSPASVEGEVSFFRTPGAILALWDLDAMAADSGLSAPSLDHFRGVSYAMNLDSPASVDAAIAEAEAIGGLVVKRAVATEWGGYSGYFADPEGNVWEVAHNPHWPLDERGLPQLP